MSGPYDCTTCDATGYVITGWDNDGEETYRRCYECKGSGETWFFLTDPNRPKGWPGEPPAMNLRGIVQEAIARQQGHLTGKKD